MAQNESEIRYLTPPTVEIKKKKYCRFKKNRIRYIDYKDPEFLKKFLNDLLLWRYFFLNERRLIACIM